ncbi:MAG: sugar phosphate nucleotidyltransferase [Bdellovibrionota bacterium]
MSLTSPTQVAILAGGLGTRLRPITEKIPKPMVEVAGKPFLYWQLLDLKQQGFTKVLLLVAYLGEQVREYFGDGTQFGLEISYSFEPSPLGTGGALKHASALLEERFLLLNGDSYLRAPLAKFDSFSEDFAAVISTYSDTEKVPVIPNLKVDVKSGRVLDYQKDAGPSLGFDRIDSGIYAMSRSLIDSHPKTEFALADLWPPLIKLGHLGAFMIDERFYDIGTPQRLQEFEEKVRDYFPDTVSN